MPELEFGILGPVQVRCGDCLVPVTRSRERALLAALLVSYGTVLSVDSLAQALWADQPPGTSRRQVAICVSRLRQAIRTAGGPPDAIATCAPGYLIGAGQLDVRSFEDAIGQARTTLAAGRPQEAADLFRDGLRLWRGPALQGVERPFAAIEAGRLEERRIMIAEELIDCELSLGRHAELVGELLVLVAANPWRERLRGRLMLALYRSGRSAEALQAYRDGRQLLVESLGVEPGPELHELHQAILRGDPVLLAPPAVGDDQRRVPASPASAAPPNQLPPDAAEFTGRARELDLLGELAERDDGSLPVAVISGMAGVGKTGLAVHWGHLASRRFPDGRLFADLRGYDPCRQPVPASTVLDQFLRSLGVPGHQLPSDLAERTALFRSLLTAQRVLIVLDNVRTADQVRPLLPGSATCMVLVTSRDRLDGLAARDGAQLCPLGPLSLTEAAGLLTRAAGGRASPAMAGQIAALCDRLPLAIRIIAARLAAVPGAADGHGAAVAAMIERLRDEQRRLSELSAGDITVRGSLELSYRELPGQAAALLRALGLLESGDFAAWAAAALLDAGVGAAARHLDELARAGLVEPVGTDGAGQARYRLHDLIRLFAREKSLATDDAAARRDATARVLGAALHLAQTADEALGNPFVAPLYGTSPRYTLAGADRPANPVAFLEAERALLTGAVAQAARLGLAGYAWELTSALCQFLSTRRYLDDWRDCAQLAATAARMAGDDRGEAAALLQLADFCADAGRFRDAAQLLARATALLHGADETALAVGLTTRAFTFLADDGAVSAQRDAERALALLDRGQSPAEPARCRALTALGLSHLYQGRYSTAANCFSRVLQSHIRSGSVRGQAEARYRLGTTSLFKGDYLAASRLLADAMRAAGEAGDLMTSMIAQVRLGQAYVELGQLDQAEPLLQQAACWLSPANGGKFRAMALSALGRLHQIRGQRA
jgi:DNA-binding SARP family transcriptional activator/tetratricopeptide (TPR) repeat protein